MAMNTTTSPDPTVCSANATLPMPPPSMSAPTTKAFLQCRASGHGTPRTQRIHAASAAPATRKRVPICRYGGKLTSAKRMAR